MARWISNRIAQAANRAGGLGGYAKAGTAEAGAVVLDEDPQGVRLGVLLAVPFDATHAVRLAIGPVPASERVGFITLPPGGLFDTTQLPAALQPSGQFTAWSGPDQDQSGGAAPGLIVLDVTEILAD